MSIIYDALKKVGDKEKPQMSQPQAVHQQSRFVLALLYILIVCMGFLLANFGWRYIVRPFEDEPVKPAAAKPESVTAAVKPPADQGSSVPKSSADAAIPKVDKVKITRKLLDLNGIFYSANVGYALINNQIVKEGGTIEGATVKQITPAKVILETGGEIFEIYPK